MHGFLVCLYFLTLNFGVLVSTLWCPHFRIEKAASKSADHVLASYNESRLKVLINFDNVTLVGDGDRVEM